MINLMKIDIYSITKNWIIFRYFYFITKIFIHSFQNEFQQFKLVELNDIKIKILSDMTILIDKI